MVIETFDLTKEYGSGKGCHQINLSVPGGEIFGFLGPNGAGKSTLVKTLVGLLFSTGGKALILGSPLGDYRIRSKIGFLPENFHYHEWLTGAEILRFHSSLYHLKPAIQSRRIPEVLKLVGLEGEADRRIGRYSKGMQQRLGIATALLAQPQLVFLDEPTSALDPIGRREIREILLGLKAQGTTVFLNSHLLSEVEMVCDQVAFIKKGRIVASGSLQELLKSRLEVELRLGSWNADLRLALEELGELEPREGNCFLIRLTNENLLPKVARTIIETGAELYEMIPHRRSLEELFISLMEEEAAE